MLPRSTTTRSQAPLEQPEAPVDERSNRMSLTVAVDSGAGASDALFTGVGSAAPDGARSTRSVVPSGTTR